MHSKETASLLPSVSGHSSRNDDWRENCFELPCHAQGGVCPNAAAAAVAGVAAAEAAAVAARGPSSSPRSAFEAISLEASSERSMGVCTSSSSYARLRLTQLCVKM